MARRFTTSHFGGYFLTSTLLREKATLYQRNQSGSISWVTSQILFSLLSGLNEMGGVVFIVCRARLRTIS